MNSYGGYFLVRKDYKKCGEYKNKNWVGILRCDSYKKAIFEEKKWYKMGEYKNENYVKNGKKLVNIRMKPGTNFGVF